MREAGAIRAPCTKTSFESSPRINSFDVVQLVSLLSGSQTVIIGQKEVKSRMFATKSLVLLFVASNFLVVAEAGIIKDIYQVITKTNNKTEDTVKQSAPICGNGLFSTPDEKTLSPEIIFITNRPSKASPQQNGYDREEDRNHRETSRLRGDNVNEVAREFRFHEENVTLAELERHGFNRDAPVSFLMHGFTSGYPLQAWISAIVEAYTIDRKSFSSHPESEQHVQHNNADQRDNYREQDRSRESAGENTGNRVQHNLFIVNWNFAARGILYTRAVANIPIVASYVTRFVNDKLLGEAGVDPRRIRLIGHSLGAHLAGFIGKNTKSKVGRIYGLDPAGPCFGTITGPLYPASKRLAPTDALEVITLHTNTALLGIEKPLGKYSVYVEGGSVQPGCKGGGVLKSLQTLTWDGGDFDTIACSHTRAPNLLTYRHDQSDTDDDCQLVAYECKDWDSFVAGHCGVCRQSADSTGQSQGPSRAVECLRVGLDWQYPKSSGGHSSEFHSTRRPDYGEDSNYQTSSSRRPTWNYTTQDHGQYSTSGYGDGYSSTRRPNGHSGYQSSTSGYDNQYDSHASSTRRPTGQSGYQSSTSAYDDQYESFSSSTRRPYGSNGQSGSGNQNGRETSDGYNSNTRRPQTSASGNDEYGNPNGNSGSGRGSSRRPHSQSGQNSNQRNRRDSNATISERRLLDQSSGESKTLFLHTGDTQPYCAYQYQVILELNEPFPKKKPPMSLVLQDSESSRDNQGQSLRRGQNSLSNDEFGNKFDDRTYTHLLTSGKKLGRVDHATLLFRDGLPDGLRLLKVLHVNYMSHIDPGVRGRLSTKLCPVRKNPGQGENFSTDKRFYFEPCSKSGGGSSSGGSGFGREREPTNISQRPNRRPDNNNKEQFR